MQIGTVQGCFNRPKGCARHLKNCSMSQPPQNTSAPSMKTIRSWPRSSRQQGKTSLQPTGARNCYYERGKMMMKHHIWGHHEPTYLRRIANYVEICRASLPTNIEDVCPPSRNDLIGSKRSRRKNWWFHTVSPTWRGKNNDSVGSSFYIWNGITWKTSIWFRSVLQERQQKFKLCLEAVPWLCTSSGQCHFRAIFPTLQCHTKA